MTHNLKGIENKDAQNQIPIICIESSCSNGSDDNSSPPNQNLPSFISDSAFMTDQCLSTYQQFLYWFSDLNASRQFIFTALSLQHLSSVYVKLAHSLAADRLSDDYHYSEICSKSSDIDYLNSLDETADDFCATVLDLLSSLDISRERDEKLTAIHDKYLSLVDRALEGALQKNLVFEDSFDSLGGQLLVAAMTTPLFNLEDRNWLQNSIKSHSEVLGSWQTASSLLALANDLSEVFGYHHHHQKTTSEGYLALPRGSMSRNVRSSSINAPFPLTPANPRGLFLSSSSFRRHHSLVPPTSENALLVPSSLLAASASSSASSPNSSGFVSGSESMYQGLNEPISLSIRGNRLAAPPNSRFYPLRRQSASPYAPQESELKEEEDNQSVGREQTGSCSSLLIKDEVSAEPSEPNSPAEVGENLLSLTVTSSGESPVDHHPVVSVSSPTTGSVNPRSPRDSASGKCALPQTDVGMAQVPIWLKSLRLHKYIGLFRDLTYQQMLGISDDWLQQHQVTQGARNKILTSIANLAARSASLSTLEARLRSTSAGLRGVLSDLRSLLQTPFPPPPDDEPCSPLVGAQPSAFLFGSDVEDDGEEAYETPNVISGGGCGVGGGLCQCPYASSDTCLFERSLESVVPQRGSVSGGCGVTGSVGVPVVLTGGVGKRPKSTECGGGSFFPQTTAAASGGIPVETGASIPKPKAVAAPEENLSEQIMRCLSQGYKVLVNESTGSGDDDNYGFFAQLLTTVLEHPSFSRQQKDQVLQWQKSMLERLGPAPPPPPRRSSFHPHHHHHHRAPARRSSYHFPAPPPPPLPTQPPHVTPTPSALFPHRGGGGGCHSAPYTPRSSSSAATAAAAASASSAFSPSATRLRPPYPQSFLQAPTPAFADLRWRGRSAEPDVTYHQRSPSSSASCFHEQAMAAVAAAAMMQQQLQQQQQQQRVASMDSLMVPSTHPYLTSGHMLSCEEPVVVRTTSGGAFADFSSSPCCCVSPFASPDGGGGGGFSLLSPPAPPGHSSTVTSSPSQPPSSRQSLSPTQPQTGHGLHSSSEYSAAEINRNLELLTEKVTKMAMEESDSPSE